MGRFRDFVARKLPVTKVRIGSGVLIDDPRTHTVASRPTADGGRAEMLTAERPFAACGKLTIDI